MKGKANILTRFLHTRRKAFLSLFLGASLLILVPGEVASQEQPGILSSLTGEGLFGGPSAPTANTLSERISCAAEEIMLEISNLRGEISNLRDIVAEWKEEVEEELEDRVEEKEDEEDRGREEEEIKKLQEVIDSLEELLGENIYPLEDELKGLAKEASNLKVQALNINSKEHELAGDIRKKENILMERAIDLGEKVEEAMGKEEAEASEGMLGFLRRYLSTEEQKAEEKELTEEEKKELMERAGELREIAGDLEDELSRLEKEKMNKLREYELMEEVGELRGKVERARKKADKLEVRSEAKKEEAPQEKGILGSLLGQLSPSEDSGGGILGLFSGGESQAPEVKRKPTPESSLADRTSILKGDIGGMRSSIPGLVEDVEEYADDFSSAAGSDEEEEVIAIENLIAKMERGETVEKVQAMTRKIAGEGKKKGLIEEGEDLAEDIEGRIEAPREEREKKMEEVGDVVDVLEDVAKAEEKIAKAEEKKAKVEYENPAVESLYELLADMIREIASE